MVPVRDRALNRVTHGLPLVPPVYPSQSKRSWVLLCREVQFTQAMGATSVADVPRRHPGLIVWSFLLPYGRDASIKVDVSFGCGRCTI